MSTNNSTGPRTQEGKERSSRNALRHGLTSEKVILPGEDINAYEEARDAFFEHFEPVNPDEIRALQRMVDSEWRLTRARRVHTAFIAQRIGEIRRENPECDHDTASAMIFTLKDEMKRMQLMMRYVSSEERAFYKAQKDFDSARKQRHQAESQAKRSTAGFVSQSEDDDFSPAGLDAYLLECAERLRAAGISPYAGEPVETASEETSEGTAEPVETV